MLDEDKDRGQALGEHPVQPCFIFSRLWSRKHRALLQNQNDLGSSSESSPSNHTILGIYWKFVFLFEKWRWGREQVLGKNCNVWEMECLFSPPKHLP